MEDYSFWADLLTSYRESPNLIKALWLMVPLVFAAGFFVLATGAAMRLMEPRGERETPSSVRGREGEPDREWLAAAAQSPLIGHERADEPVNRIRGPWRRWRAAPLHAISGARASRKRPMARL